MLKKAIAAAFVSAGLLGTLGSAAGAQPRDVGPEAACHGLGTAHGRVTGDAHEAHQAIPHCPTGHH